MIERDTYYASESVRNIAQELGFTVVTTGGTKFYENYIENIKKVTPADVKRVANKYLGVEKSAVSTVLPKKSNEVQISDKKPLNLKAALVSENSGTQKYTLSNGATLLLTPNTANDIIAISIFSKGGEFLEKIPGTGKLTASVMLKGTKKYSSTELAQIMEDNGIKIAADSKGDTFSINILTTKNEYDKTLDLINEIVNNAILDDYEIEKTRSEKINSIRKNRDLPLQRAIEEYNTLIYQGSVYSNSTKILEKTMPQIEQADIQEFYKTVLAPRNVVISINGNVDKEKTLEEMTKIFNNRTGETFDYDKHSVPDITMPRISTQTDKTTETAWIFLGWQTSGLSNLKDYAALQVIDSILGSGMSSRLFKNLRDQEGLAYQLGSNYSPSMLKGNFVVYIGTNPNTLEKAKAGLFTEINRLKTEYVGTKELQDAKDKLIGQFAIAQETNLEKAATSGWFETSKRGYDFKNKYAELINNVTESDIIEAANKYFNNNYVLSVVKN